MSTHQIDTMATDDIEMDLVDKLRLWASTEPSHVVEDLHKAADEIERLRNILIGIALNKQVWKGFNFD